MKKLYIALPVSFYLLLIEFFFIAIFDNSDIPTLVFWVSAIISITLMLFSSIFTKVSSKCVLITKLSLIPFYVFFSLVGIALSIGITLPFLFAIVLIAYVIGLIFGYASIISTSMPNIKRIFKLMIIEKKSSALLIGALIFHFIFVFDVIGAILLYMYDKNETKNEIIDDIQIEEQEF